MVKKSPDSDFDTPTTYEWMVGGERITADTQPMEGPECGEMTQNVDNPRE